MSSKTKGEEQKYDLTDGLKRLTLNDQRLPPRPKYPFPERSIVRKSTSERVDVYCPYNADDFKVRPNYQGDPVERIIRNTDISIIQLNVPRGSNSERTFDGHQLKKLEVEVVRISRRPRNPSEIIPSDLYEYDNKEFDESVKGVQVKNNQRREADMGASGSNSKHPQVVWDLADEKESKVSKRNSKVQFKLPQEINEEESNAPGTNSNVKFKRPQVVWDLVDENEKEPNDANINSNDSDQKTKIVDSIAERRDIYSDGLRTLSNHLMSNSSNEKNLALATIKKMGTMEEILNCGCHTKRRRQVALTTGLGLKVIGADTQTGRFIIIENNANKELDEMLEPLLAKCQEAKETYQNGHIHLCRIDQELYRVRAWGDFPSSVHMEFLDSLRNETYNGTEHQLYHDGIDPKITEFPSLLMYVKVKDLKEFPGQEKFDLKLYLERLRDLKISAMVNEGGLSLIVKKPRGFENVLKIMKKFIDQDLCGV